MSANERFSNRKVVITMVFLTCVMSAIAAGIAIMFKTQNFKKLSSNADPSDKVQHSMFVKFEKKGEPKTKIFTKDTALFAKWKGKHSQTKQIVTLGSNRFNINKVSTESSTTMDISTTLGKTDSSFRNKGYLK